MKCETCHQKVYVLYRQIKTKEKEGFEKVAIWCPSCDVIKRVEKKKEVKKKKMVEHKKKEIIGLTLDEFMQSFG